MCVQRRTHHTRRQTTHISPIWNTRNLLTHCIDRFSLTPNAPHPSLLPCLPAQALSSEAAAADRDDDDCCCGSRWRWAVAVRPCCRVCGGRGGADHVR